MKSETKTFFPSVRLPTPEDIHRAYLSGEEAVLDLTEDLFKGSQSAAGVGQLPAGVGTG